MDSDTFTLAIQRLNPLWSEVKKYRRNNNQPEHNKFLVIFVDEFDELAYGKAEIREDFLSKIRGLKGDDLFVINSFVGIGTYNILQLGTASHILSPFNVTDAFRNPNFTEEQVKSLFRQFLEERSDDEYQIDDKVIKSIYLNSNGYVRQI